MKHYHPIKRDVVLARISIWTIRYHDLLVAHMRMYVWVATAIILLLTIGGIISLSTPLYALLFCALGIMALLWFLIRWRKAVLLNINDVKLRQIAHAAMLSLIYSRKAHTPPMTKKKSNIRRWLRKVSHS